MSRRHRAIVHRFARQSQARAEHWRRLRFFNGVMILWCVGWGLVDGVNCLYNDRWSGWVAGGAALAMLPLVWLNLWQARRAGRRMRWYRACARQQVGWANSRSESEWQMYLDQSKAHLDRFEKQFGK